MHKQVQIQAARERSGSGLSEELEDILCDGCGHMLKEEEYIEHWEQCIKQKKSWIVKEAGQRKGEKKLVVINQCVEEIKESLEPTPKVFQMCNLCGKEILSERVARKNHELECPGMEQCEFCNEAFYLDFIEQHYECCEMRKAIKDSLSEQSRDQRENRVRQTESSSNVLQLLLNLATGETNQEAQLLGDYFRSLKKQQNLTEPELGGLKKTQFSSSGIGQLCSICRVDLQEGEEVTILKCEHLFHPECINNWLKKAVKCPNCNQRVK